MSPTITETINSYLEMTSETRSKRTAMSYRNGLDHFQRTLFEHGLDPDKTDITELPEKAISWLAMDLKYLAPATERLYLTAAAQLYEYIVAEDLAKINLPRVRQLIRHRARKAGVRLPQFDGDAIEALLDKAEEMLLIPAPDEPERDKLRRLRDRSYLLTLADTGLRVHEACNLRRGDIDWLEYQAIIIGKGDKEAVVRFSKRSINALKLYLQERGSLDGNTGRPLGTLAIFARHDKGAGKKVLPIQTNTGRNIVAERVKEFLGPEYVGTITPHSFRHRFVTVVVQVTGNIEVASKLARHANIGTTQRYTHLTNGELDKSYHEAIEHHSPTNDNSEQA